MTGSMDRRVVTEILRPLRHVRSDGKFLCVGAASELVAVLRTAVSGTWTFVAFDGQAEPGSCTSPSSDSLQRETFDVVILVGAACAESDRLRELHRVLKSDGICVLITPVLGDFSENFLSVERTAVPKRATLPETHAIAAAAVEGGLIPLSVIEFRSTDGTPASDLSDSYLELGGPLGIRASVGGAASAGEPHREFTNIEVDTIGEASIGSDSIAVLCLGKQSERVRPALVVIGVPVRVRRRRLEIYMQRRMAALYRELRFEGSLEFPQGHVEPDETMAAALSRELAEEAGLSIRRFLLGGGLNDLSVVDDVTTESSEPSGLIWTRGSLNHIALVYFVEVEEYEQAGAIDNQGVWILDEHIFEIRRPDVYPLDLPIFEIIQRRLAELRSELGV